MQDLDPYQGERVAILRLMAVGKNYTWNEDGLVAELAAVRGLRADWRTLDDCLREYGASLMLESLFF